MIGIITSCRASVLAQFAPSRQGRLNIFPYRIASSSFPPTRLRGSQINVECQDVLRRSDPDRVAETRPEEIRDARNYVFRYATVSGER